MSPFLRIGTLVAFLIVSLMAKAHTHIAVGGTLKNNYCYRITGQLCFPQQSIGLLRHRKTKLYGDLFLRRYGNSSTQLALAKRKKAALRKASSSKKKVWVSRWPRTGGPRRFHYL